VFESERRISVTNKQTAEKYYITREGIYEYVHLKFLPNTFKNNIHNLFSFFIREKGKKERNAIFDNFKTTYETNPLIIKLEKLGYDFILNDAQKEALKYLQIKTPFGNLYTIYAEGSLYFKPLDEGNELISYENTITESINYIINNYENEKNAFDKKHSLDSSLLSE
jgi:hypothetical protein